MREKLLPRLLFKPCGDPGLLLHVIVEGFEYLFDLPPVHHVSTRILRRVKAVFVSHTHVDHFVGMGHFLRVNLTRKGTLLLAGPPGFIGNVEGFLSAFTWNLGDDYPLSLNVLEVGEDNISSASFSCRNHFVRESLEKGDKCAVILENDVLKISVVVLDHGIPVLAFRVDEHMHININADALEKAGFEKGPWLQELKRSIRRGDGGERLIATPGGEISQEELVERFVIISPGQSIGYVVDVAYHEKNLQKLIPFLDGIGTLYIETAFPEEEEERAIERNHLNSFHAATIAEQVGAKRLRPLHISPRYLGKEEELVKEMGSHFSGSVQLGTPYRRS